MGSLAQFTAVAGATGDIGEGLGKRLEQLRNETQQFLGAQVALREAADKVEELLKHIDRDKEEGVLAKLCEAGTPLGDMPRDVALAHYAKKRVGQCVEALRNFAALQKSNELVAHGKVAAMEEAVGLLQKHHNAATARVQQLRQAAAEVVEEAATPTARGRDRSPGQHPGSSPLDERRAEARKAEEAPSEVPVVPVPESKSSGSSSATKPRVTRRR